MYQVRTNMTTVASFVTLNWQPTYKHLFQISVEEVRPPHTLPPNSPDGFECDLSLHTNITDWSHYTLIQV